MCRSGSSAPSLSVPAFPSERASSQEKTKGKSGRPKEELEKVDTAARASGSSQGTIWAERDDPSGTYDQGQD